MPTPTPTAPPPQADPSRAETPEKRGSQSARSAERETPPPPPAEPRRDAAGDTPFAGEVHDWNDTRDRYEMIAEAAYFKAEKRGFALGEAELDWLEAEQELIEAMEGDHVVEET